MRMYNRIVLFLFVILILISGCKKQSQDKTQNNNGQSSNAETVEGGVILNHTNDPLNVEDVGIDTETFEDNENGVLYNKASSDILMLPDRYIEKYPTLNSVIETNNNSSVVEAKNFIDQNKTEIRQMRKDRTDDTLVLSYENLKTVNRIDDLVFSYNDEISLYTGGAHGSYALLGRNYSPQDGNEITSNDMFVDKKKLKEVLIENIERDYDGSLFDDWKETLDTHFKENKPFNFSIGAEYVEIVFDPYYLGPWATGNVTVLLLYKDYKDILNKKYFELKR